MKTIWLSPTEYVTGDPSVRISYPSVTHPHTIVTSKTKGDLKWLSLGLPLPQGAQIEEITLCYQVSAPRSFISQVRLSEMATPEQALVRHDDATDLTSTSPARYTSRVSGVVTTAALTLDLRLNFQHTKDQILLGAVGITFQTPLLVTSVQNMATLKSLAPDMAQAVQVLGYDTPGDGGGGSFYWDASASEADNGGTVIVPDSSPTPGRWKRLLEGPLSVKWFGAKGDGTTDDTYAIQLAINVALANVSRTAATLGSSTVLFPKGLYMVTSGFALSKAITLCGEGVPAGGVNANANTSSTILHAGTAAYDLFTFNGSDAGGASVTSGGGVERLRIVQTSTVTNPGSAIVIKATSGSPSPSWTKLRLLVIEELDGSTGWNWAMQIDGSASTEGIPNLFIGEVATHVSDGSGHGALQMICGSGCLVYNCQFHINGSIEIKGTSTLSSLDIELANVNCGGTSTTLKIGDYAGNVAVVGGYYKNITTTSNTSGTILIVPARLGGTFTDGSSSAAGMLRYDPSGLGASGIAGFRFSRPALLEKALVLSNEQWTYGMNAAGTAAVALFGIDLNDAARLVLAGSAWLGVGQLPGGIGSPAAPDILLGVDNATNKHHVAIRSMNNALTTTNRIVATDASDNLQLGQDTPGTQLNNKLGCFGTTPISKPTVTGSRGGNAALASLLAQLAALGLVTDSTT